MLRAKHPGPETVGPRASSTVTNAPRDPNDPGRYCVRCYVSQPPGRAAGWWFTPAGWVCPGHLGEATGRGDRGA
jgi:8-oxo-dGTP pyrophosphatase MutT (NUDIX family)